MKNPTKVYLVSAVSPKDKVHKLTQICTNYLYKKLCLYLLIEKEHLQWLDAHLWKYPQDSFLPHSIYDETAPCDAPILLSSTENSPRSFHTALNLSKRKVQNTQGQLKKIIEFEEKSHDKSALQQEKLRYYKEQGYHLVSVNLLQFLEEI